MPAISRRSVLGGLTLLAASPSLAAATAEKLSVDAADGRVPLDHFASGRTGKRPAVLVLHGSRGFDLRPQAYERYANALTADGIDAYFVRYYTPADEQAFATMHTSESREAYETGRFDGWAARVSSVLTAVLAGADSSGRTDCSASRSAAMLRRRRRRATLGCLRWPCCMAACPTRLRLRSSICRR
jgi:carboxymethylenebutenolidase